MSELSRWYLVQCKPRESFRAELHLANQNYEVFHPTCLVKRKVSGRIHTSEEPLFPHYLFIRLNDSHNWSSIRSTRGVSRMVTFNGVPASLDDHLIMGLQEHCERLRGRNDQPIHKVGDRVLVTDGCFKELEAIVTSVNGDERVVLLLNLMNRPQRIELPIHSVVGLN